jgi:uncharacterized membrane protein
MFPLGIFYRLLPYAQALLFLQSFVTAIAIVPLRQICAFAGFKNKDLISFLYLVNPLTIFSNLFDFHLEAFMPLFFLFLVLSLLNEDVLRTIVFSFATFSVYEDGAIMVLAAIFFVVLLKQKIYMMMFRDLLKTNLNSPGVRFLAVLFFLGISSFLYYLVSWRIINYYNPTLPQLSGEFTTEMFRTDPLAGISYQIMSKALYIFLPIACLGFVPLFKPKFLVLSSPFWILAIISNYSAFYEFGVQYGYLIVPGIMVAAIFGFAAISNRSILSRSIKIAALVISIVTVLSITMIGISLVPYQSLGPGATIKFGSPYSTAEYNLARMVPQNATVLAWSGAFPFVANDLGAYSVPTAYHGSAAGLYEVMNKSLSLHPRYLLLNFLGGSFPFFNNFSSFISSNYGVFAEDGGSILLEWHYDSEPVYFRGYSISYLSSAFSPPHSLQDIYYWHGPWTSLIIGNYSLTITYTSNSTRVVQFLITANSGKLILYSHLETITSTTGNNTKSVYISFFSSNIYENVEFLALRVSQLNVAIVSASLTEDSP